MQKRRPTRFTLVLDAELLRRLDAVVRARFEAAGRDPAVTRAALVREAIRQYVERAEVAP